MAEMFRRTFLALVGLAEGTAMGNDNPTWHSQSQGAKETAAQESSLQEASKDYTINANSDGSIDLFTNNSGQTLVLEFVSISQDSTYTDTIEYEIEVLDANDNVDFQWFGNPQNLPAVFDPALPVVDGGEVEVLFSNDAASQVTGSFSCVLRQP